MSVINEVQKGYFDRFMPRPRDGFCSANVRNNNIALASCDFLPCRAIVAIVIESHDIGFNDDAAQLYSGTGVTVAKNKTYPYEGYSCLQATVDGTGNRQIIRAALTTSIDLSSFGVLGVWTRCNITSSTIQYLIKDNAGNESYWNITTHGTADSWQQAFLTLGTPDANNGTNADLTQVVRYGYKGLDASIVYLFGRVTGYVWSMNVWIDASYIADYFYPVYIGGVRIKYDGGLCSTITAPTSLPRIDLISLKNDGTIVVTAGSEVAVPGYANIPATPANNVPLYAVYLPTTATKIVEYHYKTVFPTDGYIYADLRPWGGY